MDTDCSFIDYSFINFGSNTESLLTTSQYAKVIFHNIEEKYSLNLDLICEYSLTEQFNANPGDRIVLFRLGWQQATDYTLFEWAPLPGGSSTLQVKFQADSLPRDTNEFYQLCYMTSENAVCGASVPFQFTHCDHNLVTSTDSDFISVQMDSAKSVVSTSGVSSLDQSSSLEADTTIKEIPLAPVSSHNCQVELAQLRDENEELKSEIAKTNSLLLRCDNQMSELKSEVNDLKNMLRVTQNDVVALKVRMDVANDEYKKLYAEKMRTEKKYDKLVKKCQGRSRRSAESESEGSSDFLGELEPLPPFPLLM